MRKLDLKKIRNNDDAHRDGGGKGGNEQKRCRMRKQQTGNQENEGQRKNNCGLIW
jgi:hypothetical protein